MFSYPASLNIHLSTGMKNWGSRRRQEGESRTARESGRWVHSQIQPSWLTTVDFQIGRSEVNNKSDLNFRNPEHRKAFALSYSILTLSGRLRNHHNERLIPKNAAVHSTMTLRANRNTWNTISWPHLCTIHSTVCYVSFALKWSCNMVWLLHLWGQIHNSAPEDKPLDVT